MPLSIASPTRNQPATGAAADSAASAITKAERPRPPLRVAPQARETGALTTRLHGPRLANRTAKGPPPASSVSGAPSSTIRPSRQHDCAVGDEDRRETLAREQDGAPGDGRAEVRDEQPLGLRVDRGHRVVEHEHACARDQRSRQRHALALSAREVDAALADQRVVAVGQLVHELRHAGRLARFEHVAPVGLGAGGEQVLPQRDGEEDRTLGDERDGPTQVVHGRRRARRRRRGARGRPSGRRSAAAG